MNEVDRLNIEADRRKSLDKFREKSNDSYAKKWVETGMTWLVRGVFIFLIGAFIQYTFKATIERIAVAPDQVVELIQ